MARFGSDRTVICVRQGDRVIDIASYDEKGHDGDGRTGQSLRGAILAGLRPCGRDRRRRRRGDRLTEQGVPGVTGINVAQRATNPEHFANLKAELYDGLRERFQQGRIRIPDNQKLISELASIRYSFTSSGQTRLEDKDELRGRGQPSPDLAMP